MCRRGGFGLIDLPRLAPEARIEGWRRDCEGSAVLGRRAAAMPSAASFSCKLPIAGKGRSFRSSAGGPKPPMPTRSELDRDSFGLEGAEAGVVGVKAAAVAKRWLDFQRLARGAYLIIGAAEPLDVGRTCADAELRALPGRREAAWYGSRGE